MTPHPHYHWQWADTYFGGRNIDVFEGRKHIATTFTEDDAKRIIAGLRCVFHSSSKTSTIDAIKLFEKEPPDALWTTMDILAKLKNPEKKMW